MIDVVKQLVGVGTPPVERRLQWWVDNFRFKMERSVSRLRTGEWDLPTFQAWGRQEIKDTLYGIAETGAGRRLTRKEVYQVRKTYKEQIGYWDKFAQAIEDERKALAERGLTGDELEEAYDKLYAKFDRRAQSYYGAIEAEGLKWVLAQNEGAWYQWNLRPAEHCISCIERKGEIHQVKDGRLPWYPKDGSTQCLYNCLCFWKPIARPPKRKRPKGERRRGRKLAEKHYGPGPHPGTGTPQSVHGRKGAKARTAGRAPEGEDTTTEAANTFLIKGLFPERMPGIGATAGTTIWKGAHDDIRAKAKAEIVSTLAKKTDTPEEYVNDFIKQWAHSSNDEDMRSLAIQEDAAKEFDVPLSKFTKDRIETIRAEVAARGEGPLPPEWRPLLKSERQRAILRAMYEHTQSQLAEAGFKSGQTIRLYRGVKLPMEIAEKWNEGDVIPIKGNALQSWSLDKQVAEYFAGNWQVGGIVFEMDVPVERIVGTARTGFGCLVEGEFVIMGGTEDTGRVAYRAW